MPQPEPKESASPKPQNDTVESPLPSETPHPPESVPRPLSSSPQSLKGLVAFFDILGYQKIVDNNEVEIVARLITDVIERIPDSVSRAIDKLGLPKHAVVCIDRIQCRIISDSILLSCEWASGLAGAGLLLMFKLYCATLMKLSFDAGLPLRGAISFGDYFVSQNSFAGKPIIECYAVGNSLDLSGCVLTDSAAAQLRKEFDMYGVDVDPMPDLLLQYSVPCKNGPSRRMSVLKWAFRGIGRTLDGVDIRRYVIEAFQKHNKDIEPEVLSKVEHTEMMLNRIWPWSSIQ